MTSQVVSKPVLVQYLKYSNAMWKHEASSTQTQRMDFTKTSCVRQLNSRNKNDRIWPFEGRRKTRCQFSFNNNVLSITLLWKNC